MPPKKNINKELLILKVKRQASTYVVDLSIKDTVQVLKDKMVDMINSTNGLKVDDSPVTLEVQDMLDTEKLHDVKVPQIGLDDSDSDADQDHDLEVQHDNNNGDVSSLATELNNDSNVQISAEHITLGVIDDPNNIYDSQITDLDVTDSTKISTLGLQDFATLAFRFKDETYKIYKPQYD